MTRAYTPLPGTTAARVIAALKGQPAGTRIRSRALAALAGVPMENLGKKLDRAVNVGLIEFHLLYRKCGEWSLPAE